MFVYETPASKNGETSVGRNGKLINPNPSVPKSGMRNSVLITAALLPNRRCKAGHWLPVDCTVEFANFADSPAIQLPFDNPSLDKARAALQAEWGKKTIMMGAGGSIPIVGDFKSVLGMDSLMVGFALDDDRVHSPNEKFDLTSFHKGIRSWARILDVLAA